MWQTEDIVRIIEEQGDTIALVYFSGMVVQSHDSVTPKSYYIYMQLREVITSHILITWQRSHGSDHMAVT